MPRRSTSAAGVPVVDVSKPPGRDESSFLVALLTAVCRPSLHLAAGCAVAGGAHVRRWAPARGCLPAVFALSRSVREPHAVTAGATAGRTGKNGLPRN